MNLKGNLFNAKQRRFPWFGRARHQAWPMVKLVLIILIIFLTAVALLAYPLAIKAKLIYRAADQGKAHLQAAENLARDLDLASAAKELRLAEDDFSQARTGLRQFIIFYKFPWLGKQLAALDNLLLAASTGSSAADDILALASDLLEAAGGLLDSEGNLVFSGQELTFRQISKEQKRKILETLTQSPPLLAQTKSKIDLAVEAFNKIPEKGLAAPLAAAIKPLAEQLPELHQTIAKAVPAAEILPRVLGYPKQKTYLFLLQNSSELRPTGGFIGTYGIIKFDTAEIKTFITDNIYKLDLPAEGLLNIPAPAPLQKYIEVKKWYLRDANWHPDYEVSARKAEELYLAEIAPLLRAKQRNADDPWYATIEPSVDGVIAITPEVIKDLLDVVGQITIDGETFNRETLVDLLEYKVEKGYAEEGLPEIQRKRIIGELALIIRDRLFSLPAAKWPLVLNILKDNLNQKHILIYDKEPQLRDLLRLNNWDGKIIDTDGDFLMVVDANMASLKTDQVMERTIDYYLEERNGNLLARVKINYHHRGEFSWKITRYRDYARVYAPLGSQLLAAQGMMENDKIKDPKGTPGRVDQGEEFGKTFFGAFISIEPGESKSLSFEYQLPEEVKNLYYQRGLYNLFIQKQPGTVGHNLTIELDFDKKIKRYLPEQAELAKSKSLIFKGRLFEDIALGARF